MEQSIKKFVLYSIRYQILLAQHVAGICNSKIYIFDQTGFFEQPEDTKVEVIDNIRTVSKEGQRAVLSVAVSESFGTDEALFLQFVDEGVTQKDDIGLYVIGPKKIEKVVEVEEKIEDGVVDQDLNDISEAIQKLEVVLN
jgi:hypothetical protein